MAKTLLCFVGCPLLGAYAGYRYTWSRGEGIDVVANVPGGAIVGLIVGAVIWVGIKVLS